MHPNADLGCQPSEGCSSAFPSKAMSRINDARPCSPEAATYVRSTTVVELLSSQDRVLTMVMYRLRPNPRLTVSVYQPTVRV